MRWRDHASPIIAAVIAETKGQDEKAIRRAIREAYPFGERQHHPYKIWCDEVRLQLGLKKSKKLKGRGRPAPPPDPNQQGLFTEEIHVST